MKRIWRLAMLAGLFIGVLGLSATAFAAPTKYDTGKSWVKIYVYHMAKTVKAKSKKVSGFATFEKKGDHFKLDGALTVPIRTLDSNNASRNNVMWNSLGDSIQNVIYFYPKKLVFTGKGPKGRKGYVEGEFNIRKKSKRVKLTFKKFKGKIDGGQFSLYVKGFLKCSDYGVSRPSLLFVKIKDKVKVRLKLRFKKAS